MTDYSIGQTVIYAAFALSQMKLAYRHVFELAAKHHVGFFDVDNTHGHIWVPAPGGKLIQLLK
jgi:hypothetical protein